MVNEIFFKAPFLIHFPKGLKLTTKDSAKSRQMCPFGIIRFPTATKRFGRVPRCFPNQDFY